MFQRLLSLLLRLLLLAVGFVAAALLLVMGLAFAVVLVLWSLLRGRRPQLMRFRMDPRSPFAGMRRPPAEADVVDIEAREVPDRPQQLHRDPG